MVRLSENFPSEPEATRPVRKEDPPPGVSLPEILILSDDTAMVDLIRGAIEDRGYRIRYFPTATELQIRLKSAGRVVMVVDGRIEGAGSFLRDIATSDYPDRIVILPDTDQKGLFDGIPDLRLQSLPVTARELLTTIEELSTAPATRPGSDKTNLFSSITKPETDQAPRKQEVSSDIPDEPPEVELLLDTAPANTSEIPDPVEQVEVAAEEPVEEPVADEPADAEKAASDLEGPARMSDMVSTMPVVPEGVEKPTIPESATLPTAAAPVSSDNAICDTVTNLYQDAVAVTLQYLRGHRGRSDPPISGVAQIVEQLIGNMTSSSDLCLKSVQHTSNFEDADQYLAYHHVNVAILAMRVGMGLQMSSSDLYELTLSGIVHDVGMTQLPAGLITRQGKLDQSGYAQIKQHPSYGKQLLASCAAAYPFLQTVAYQEHERLDGSGYPEGLSGNGIHLFARIIGLVDTYEALTHVRPFRDHMIPFNVLQQLIRLGGHLFDKDVVKAFLDEISVFPAGSYVKLNSGEICIVSSVNKNYPLRPVVRVYYTADGSKLEEGRTIDLKSEPMLYITDPEDPRDFPKR